MPHAPHAALIIALSLAGCAEQPAPAQPALSATHGGTLVEVGPHACELVVHASGELHVHALSSDADLSRAGVTVTLSDRKGTRRSVALRFLDRTQGFVGHVDAPAPRGRIDVLMVDDGRRSLGRAQVAHLLPQPAHGGSIVAAGDRVIEVVVDDHGETRAYASEPIDALTVGIPDEQGSLHFGARQE